MGRDKNDYLSLGALSSVATARACAISRFIYGPAAFVNVMSD